MAQVKSAGDVLDQVQQGVLYLQRPRSHDDRPLYALRRQARVAVAKAPVQTQCALVRNARADADPTVTASTSQLLRGLRELGPDAAPTELSWDEDVPDLRHAKRCLFPRDVRMADWFASLPGHQIGLGASEPVQGQPVADPRYVGVGQLADVDAATIRLSKVSAPSLSSISFRLPHFGL